MIRSPLSAAGLFVFSCAFLLLNLALVRSEEQSSSPNFFLPKNPVAAAYVLGRLSNRELIEAPRSEFVDVALLERKGMDKTHRLEALEGLVEIRHTDRMTELLRAVEELDKKGDEFSEPLRDLVSILLRASRTDLTAKRDHLRELTKQAQLAVTRQSAYAALIAADATVEPTWGFAQSTPVQLADLVHGLPLIVDASLRAQFYDKVKALLTNGDSPELQVAAINAIPALPGHDSETFTSLAALVQSGNQTAAAIDSLNQIPMTAWAKQAAAPLSKSLVDHLQKIPPEERTTPQFANALQFGIELASLLPATQQQTFIKTLRKTGPTVITMHAVLEQMRFDREQMIVQADKPTVIILQNDDSMPHNLAILQPGALKEVALAAEKMTPEPDSEGRLYVPATPKVLQATRLVNPGEKMLLAFNAPAEPGEYPFVCTFPGHWLRMAGTMLVVTDLDAYLASHPNAEEPKLTEWKLTDFAPDWSRADQGRNLFAGKELFSKLACVQCHKIGTEGYNYGPELTDIFKRYKADRAAVLQQILEPSKIIEDRYRNFNIQLKNGDSLTAMILKEDQDNLTIQSGPADSLIQNIKKSEIRDRGAQSTSPMPVGLLNALSKPQVLDLLAYLQSGGVAPPHEHAILPGETK